MQCSRAIPSNFVPRLDKPLDGKPDPKQEHRPLKNGQSQPKGWFRSDRLGDESVDAIQYQIELQSMGR